MFPLSLSLAQFIIFAHGKKDDRTFQWHGPNNAGSMLYDFSHGGPGSRTERPVSFLLLCHVVCMISSWGCIFCWGAVLARKKSSKWFSYHRTLQSIGWCVQLVGIGAIIAYVQSNGSGDVVHFTSLHSKIGLVVCSIGTLQPLNALIRPHPVDPETGQRTTGRLCWEVLHKTSGWGAILGGMVNVVLGILLLHQQKYVNSFVVATIGLGTFAEGSILIFVLFDWMSAVSGANAANGKRLGRNVGDEQSYESLPGDRL